MGLLNYIKRVYIHQIKTRQAVTTDTATTTPEKIILRYINLEHGNTYVAPECGGLPSTHGKYLGTTHAHVSCCDSSYDSKTVSIVISGSGSYLFALRLALIFAYFLLLPRCTELLYCAIVFIYM